MKTNIIQDFKSEQGDRTPDLDHSNSGPPSISFDPEKARRSGEGSLSQSQIAFYDREGYLVLENLLNEEDRRPFQESVNRRVDEIARELFHAGLIENKFENSPFETRLSDLFTDLSQEDFLKYGRSWRDRLPGYFQLMGNPKILAAVESLIGGEIFSNPVYNTRPKVPKVAAGAVPWHQDKSYWPGANANPVITVWVAMVNATHENGCLHIWPQTHNTNVLPWHKESETGTGFTEIDEVHLRDVRAVPLPVPAGSAILFNDRCIHMSTPNNSNHTRWSCDLRYQPTNQDPMVHMGTGFLARSREHPERVANLVDWLDEKMEHQPKS